RRDERRRVEEVMQRHLGIELKAVDASEEFLGALQGVTDPEEKRRRIGATFIKVFEAEAAALTGVDFLAQGTLYPDVIESTSHDTHNAHRIKTHHNVGGLPADLRFKLVEPLRYLFKDEVRAIGTALGLPEDMVQRQPFPGPGLAVRIIGEVTRERLETLRAADWIVVDEIKAAGLYRSLWQSFAILTPLQSVGVMGDYRTYGNVVAVRAVQSEDGMTADWARLPYEVLAAIAVNTGLQATDVDGIARFNAERDIALTLIGPEAAVDAGLADRLAQSGRLVFGPTKAAGRIESSKAFAKSLMTRAEVATPAYRVFED